jgi:hypothetical protein
MRKLLKFGAVGLVAVAAALAAAVAWVSSWPDFGGGLEG